MTPAPQLLDTLLLSPPGPAAIALLLASGLHAIALVTIRRLLGVEHADSLTQAAGFALMAAALAAVVHLLALAGLSSVATLRGLGSLLIAANALYLWPRQRRAVADAARAVRRTFDGVSGWRRLAVAGCAVLTVSLLATSLAPPTDFDSLAYHLPVPLTWLANEGAYAAPHWLYARLVGIGEAVSMLGLAMGTDSFGSLLQAAGLPVMMAAACSAARSADDRLFAVLLVAACPLWSNLALASKPQLLPAAAAFTALALVWRQWSSGSATAGWRHLLLVFALAFYAAACKYSFLPGAGVLAAAVAWRQWRAGGAPAMKPVVATGALAFSLLVLPVWLRNLWFYGDPLSPILERWTADPDPAVITFSWYLRSAGGEHSLINLLRLPFDLIVPTGVGHFTAVLGAGGLAVLVAVDRHRPRQCLLVLAAAIALITALFGQLQARFFLEPYLWCSLAAIGAACTWRKRALRVALALQLAPVVVIALFALHTLGPGALAADARERVLRDGAADYQLAHWLDDVLPGDAVVVTDRLPRLHARRPVLAYDYVRMTWMSRIRTAEKKRRTIAALRSAGVNTMVLTVPRHFDTFGWLEDGAAKPVMASPAFADAVRNRWRRQASYRVEVFDLRQHPLIRDR